MEQFDSEYQSALSAAVKAGVKDAEQLADAGMLNRKDGNGLCTKA
jgi:hypothetical protein